MTDSSTHLPFLALAIEIATESVNLHQGGPFGAVIVRDGKALTTGTNRVTASNDPTAHAEIVAIRDACEILGTHQLTGCTIYCSCEPCPMCLGAIYWARPDAVYFAATRQDATQAGFDDSLIYEEIALSPANRQIPTQHLICPNATQPFEAWSRLDSKREY